MPRKARSTQSRRSYGRSQRAKMTNARKAKNFDKLTSTSPPSPTPQPLTSSPSTSLPTPTTSTPAPCREKSTQPSSSITTSAKKLGFLSKQEHPSLQHSEEFSTTIIHLETLQSLFSNVRCAECGGCVTLRQDDTVSKGLAVGLVVDCQDCLMICGSSMTSRMATSRAPEVNRSIVAASLAIGIGYRQLTNFCEVIGMPSVNVKTFQTLQAVMHRRALTTLESTCAEARYIVKELYEPDDDGIRNITVSFDGTWHKRGHTSLHGAAAVICAVTGLVLDTHVMSLHCQLCVTKKSQMDEEDFDEWMEGHEQDCQKNYDGTSGGMEVEAAKVLWSRSLNYGLRYTTMVGDGDCKTYNTLTTLAPYDNIPISKAECVNHVAKRLGTRLRNLVNEERRKGLTLGGKGEGTLTQDKIARLQGYYTKAVRSNNSSVPAMRVAIWATFHHCTSTDEEPRHHSCPGGPTSWCFFKRALATGKQPSSQGHLSTYLKPAVAKCVERVYEQLTEEDLLSRCLLGKTQNANESFHAQLWRRCPKHIFVSKSRVEVATVLAVGEWNKGSLATHSLMWNMGLEINSSTIKLGQKRDQRRLKMAEAAMDTVTKKRKEVQREARAREAERLREEEEEKEGGPVYLTGAH